MPGVTPVVDSTMTAPGPLMTPEKVDVVASSTNSESVVGPTVPVTTEPAPFRLRIA